MLFGDGMAVTHPGATDARVSPPQPMWPSVVAVFYAVMFTIAVTIAVLQTLDKCDLSNCI